MKIKIGDLVRVIKEPGMPAFGSRHPWAVEVWRNGTPLLVLHKPSDWREAPLSGDHRVICVLYKNKLRVVRKGDVEVISA